MDILEHLFIQQPPFRHRPLHIRKRAVVVRHLVDLAQRLAANRQPILEDNLRLDQRQRVALDRRRVVRVFHIKAARKSRHHLRRRFAQQHSDPPPFVVKPCPIHLIHLTRSV